MFSPSCNTNACDKVHSLSNTSYLIGWSNITKAGLPVQFTSAVKHLVLPKPACLELLGFYCLLMLFSKEALPRPVFGLLVDKHPDIFKKGKTDLVS